MFELVIHTCIFDMYPIKLKKLYKIRKFSAIHVHQCLLINTVISGNAWFRRVVSLCSKVKVRCTGMSLRAVAVSL